MDNVNVVLDPSDDEIYYAFWFKNKEGIDVTLRPRSRYVKGVSSADYSFYGDLYDLKSIEGRGDRTVIDAIKKAKNQADNFIIDIKHIEGRPHLSIKKAEDQIRKVKSNNSWIGTVYLFDGKNYIGVFK